MAAQSKLSDLDPQAVAAVRSAQAPRRAFWASILRLVLQHALTMPVTLGALPFIILKNLFPFLRSHPLWSFRTAISTELTRLTLICMSLIRFCPVPNRENGWREGALLGPILQALSFSSAGDKFNANKKLRAQLKITAKRLDRVWFDPPPVEFLRGILSVKVPGKAEDQIVESPRYRGRPLILPEFAKARCRAFWYMRKAGTVPPHPNDGQKRTRPVMLYIHGGAGVSFAAADLFCGEVLAKNLARTANIDVFTVDYDLAPHARYPTVALQALGAWLYLTRKLGYSASQIYIGGDSYGGFATLLFNRYMRDVWDALPQEVTRGESGVPAGLLLFSPWLALDHDVPGSTEDRYPSRRTHGKTDIVVKAFAEWGTDDLGIGTKHIKRTPLHPSNAWITLLNMEDDEFAELPPLFVQAGAAEQLHDEDKHFADKARAAGVDTEWLSSPGMPHDIPTSPFLIPEARQIYRRVKTWIERIEAGKAVKRV